MTTVKGASVTSVGAVLTKHYQTKQICETLSVTLQTFQGLKPPILPVTDVTKSSFTSGQSVDTP